jgi:hypothetical protein
LWNSGEGRVAGFWDYGNGPKWGILLANWGTVLSSQRLWSVELVC